MAIMKSLLFIGIFFLVFSLSAEDILFQRNFCAAEDLKGIDSIHGAQIVSGSGLRFTVPEDAVKPHNTASVPLLGDMIRNHRITVSAEVKVALGAPEKRWLGAWLAVWAGGGKGTENVWKRQYIGTGKQDWKKVTFSCDIPDTVTRGYLEFGINGARGTVCFRNLKITADAVLLPLEQVANWGFADRTAGDGKGGWHDQGAVQDASGFPVGRKTFANVPFRVLDPNRNGGKAIAALRCPRLPSLPEDVTISVKTPVRGKYLYLLHSSAWGEPKGNVCGTIELTGTKGTAEIPVVYGKDLTDWWKGNPVENAVVGAFITPRDGFGAAYVSRFDVPESVGGISEITFRKRKESGVLWLVIAATVSSEKYRYPEARKTRVQADRVWKALPQSVKAAPEAGSALDLSGLFPRHTVGVFGRVVIGRSGQFEFEKRPGIPARFFSFNQNREFGGYFTKVTEISSRQDAREYADQIARNGYNMVRIWGHHMRTGNWKNLKAFEFDPVLRDLFDYLLYCLKQRGVYIYLSLNMPALGFDRCYPWGGAEKNDWDLFRHKRDFDAWCKGAELVLDHVNPYTNMRWIDDPQIAAIDCNNEQEFAFLKADDRYAELFREFLKKKYGSVDRLKQAWGKEAETIRSFEDIRKFQPLQKDRPGAVGRDRAEFMTAQESGLYERELAFLRKLGYKGPVTSFAMGKSMRHAGVRREFEFVTMNAYHDHPSGGPLGKGGRINQNSSIGSGANTVRSYLAARLYGKPFLVSEHGHCFWNKYRYEHGFVLGGYAALNGFDALTAFAMTPTRNTNRKIVDFEIRFDPIRRATEVMTALLFRRGDVKTAPFETRIAMDLKEAIRNGELTGSVSGAQLYMGLVGRCSVDQTALPVRRNELRIPRSGVSATVVRRADSSVVDSGSPMLFDMDKVLASLKSRGILPAENRTEASKEYFVSATGELVMDSRRNRMTVETERFQGICAEAGSRAEFRNFRVLEMNRRGCLALASIDGTKSIADSGRLLLFVVTNALNSGMVFEGEDQRVCLNHGDTPILLETGVFSVEIRTSKIARMKAWALALNGTRIAELPLRRTENGAVLKIDTAAIPNGPAVYFELAAE